MVDGVDPFGDVDCDGVPASVLRILWVEVVGGVLAGTATVLDDVLVSMSDDDGEIAVGLDSLFGDGLDSPVAAVAVGVDDRLDDLGCQLALLGECDAPVVPLGHDRPFSGGRLNRFGALFAVTLPTKGMYVREGDVELEVPERREGASEGSGEAVFYNPHQELNRDVTVATLTAYRDRNPHAQTYLDAMTASGIRGVRAATAGYDVTCVDVDPDAVALARRNFTHNDLSGNVVQRDANALMHESAFDVIDLDPFGTPIPFADAALSNARNLVCVTATDTAPLCGAHFDSGVRTYSTVPRNTEYHREMGLRVLLSAMIRTAARYDVAATPVLSHVSRHYVRTYLELDRGATAANDLIDRLGYVHHCQDCLARSSERELIAHPPETCPVCESQRVVTAGPIWLGAIAEPEFVRGVRETLDEQMGEYKRARRLLATVADELDTPTHYDQHRLCEEWGRPASAMDDFLDALRTAGFEASRAHYAGTAFKTDASVEAIRTATADLL